MEIMQEEKAQPQTVTGRKKLNDSAKLHNAVAAFDWKIPSGASSFRDRKPQRFPTT